MSLKQITLVFPQNKIKEPVVFLMAKECGVIPNIRRARVTETVGEMTLEINGSDADLKKAIQFLESHGVKVESASGGTSV